MKNQLTQFQSEEFGSLEVLMIDGKPYFPATESAKMLGYSNPHDAVSRHCPHSVKHGVGVQTGKKSDGGAAYQTVMVNFIPEGDLYRLIIRSKLPAAVRFETWVFDEVLPSVRRHGAYITDEVLEQILQSPELAFQLFQELQAEKGKTAALLDKVHTLAPKARYCDVILQSKNAVQVTLIARDYGMTAVAFNRLLHDLGIQFRIGPTWVLYKRFVDQGYTRSNTYHTPSGCGVVHTCWTQKGRLFLYDTLCAAGIFPMMEVLGESDDFDFFDDYDEEALN